jgi:hypothetical protein
MENNQKINDAELRLRWHIKPIPAHGAYVDIIEADGADPAAEHDRAELEMAVAEVARRINTTDLEGLSDSQLSIIARIAAMLDNEKVISFLWCEGCEEIDFKDIRSRELPDSNIVAMNRSKLYTPERDSPDMAVSIRLVAAQYVCQAMAMIAIIKAETEYISHSDSPFSYKTIEAAGDRKMDSLADAIAFWFFEC